ncbi:ArsR/SmtB family transcription factor [Natronorubrum tibetense]|uniref:ArsR family transcriptional regulator n=1 Tax=Natronorubrum tibetense GA33 TaxID=1114856 RepID=L9VXR4_9EURY|nr:metalloregulator ArsR/SmtB family transcription factor [Natronorubrum tibetense]ELY41811.1 ArsR family transcriptional regulator [Natronorubrum tibetense GA33]
MTSDDSQRNGPEGCELSIDDDTIASVTDRPLETQVDLFSTLGNETRYRILLLLAEADEPVCGCEIEPHLDVGQSSISQSLSRLRKAGLVSRTKDGRWRYYEPTEIGETLAALVESDVATEPLIAD